MIRQTIPASAGKRDEYADEARAAFVDAGRRLFLERGFWSVPDIVLARDAGLTRGALYYYFAGMEEVFEAVYNQLQQETTEQVAAALTSHSDPWQQVLAGIDAYLTACRNAEYREIVMLQGPSVLGLHRWRELDQGHFQGQLEHVVRMLQDAGHLGHHPADLIAAAGRGSLTELALGVADSADPDAAHIDACRIAREMLEGLDRQLPPDQPANNQHEKFPLPNQPT